MAPPVQTGFPCPKQCFSSSPTSTCCLLHGENSPSVSPPHLLPRCAARACPTTGLTSFSCGLAAFLMITPSLFSIICYVYAALPPHLGQEKPQGGQARKGQRKPQYAWWSKSKPPKGSCSLKGGTLQMRGDGRTLVCCIRSGEMIMTLTLNAFTKPTI